MPETGHCQSHDETPAVTDKSQVDPDRDDSIGSDPHIVLPRRKWVVEPVCLLYCIAMFSQSPVVSQYIYYKVGLQFNGTSNSSRAFVCDRDSLANSSEHDLTNRIQDEASSWSLYRSTVSSLVALIVLPLYASSSDYLGRKPVLLLPVIGSALDSIGVLLVVLLNLPLTGLVVSSGVGALGGGFGTMFATMFAFLADTTSRKGRPIRVAIVEAMFGVAGVVMELVMGWWIKLMGYTVPLVFSCTVSLVIVLYVIFLVPEVRLRNKDPKTTGLSPLRIALLPFANIVNLFRTSARVAATLALLLVSLGVFCTSFMGSSTVSSLYQMNFPFCLDSVFIGYLGAAKIVGYQIGATIGLLVFRKHLGMSTLSLIVLGLLSSGLGSLTTGLAQTTAMLFVAAGVSMFSMLAIPMFRAFTSQIAAAERQGALFSCIGVLEVAGNLIGSAGFTLLYKSTLAWMPGFVYIVSAGVTGLALLLTALCYGLDVCCPRDSAGGSDEADANSKDTRGLVNDSA